MDYIPCDLEFTYDAFLILFSWEKKYIFYTVYGPNQLYADDQKDQILPNKVTFAHYADVIVT